MGGISGDVTPGWFRWVKGEFGVSVGYQHWWLPICGRTCRTATLNFMFQRSWRIGQVDRGDKRLMTAHINLIWSPAAFIDTGIGGRARFWRTLGANSKPWSANSVPNSNSDNIRPSRPPGKAG
jgi:hypothetical protein